MIRRWLLMLSASAAVHLAVLGLALVVGGAGAGSAILMDLVADVEGDAASGARAQSSTGSASAGAERPRTERPRRITAHPAQRDLSAGSPIPAPVQSSPVVAEPAPAPKPEADAETRPKTQALAEAESAVAPIAPLPDAAGPPAPLGAQASSSSIASDVAKPRDERAAAAAGAAPGVDAAASTEGSMRAGSAGGAPGSSVALGTPGEARGGIPPEYVPYLQRFRRHVQESLQYPLVARRRGISGKVDLEVLLEPSGRIGAVRVISSSSHAVLDEAALKAVRSLVPEPLPEHLPRRPLRIRLPLAFELE